MAEVLDIPVFYKSRNFSFKATVYQRGYVQQVVVDVEGVEVTIERDDENEYRAIVDLEKLNEAKVDPELIKALVEVFKDL